MGVGVWRLKQSAQVRGVGSRSRTGITLLWDLEPNAGGHSNHFRGDRVPGCLEYMHTHLEFPSILYLLHHYVGVNLHIIAVGFGTKIVVF